MARPIFYRAKSERYDQFNADATIDAEMLTSINNENVYVSKQKSRIIEDKIGAIISVIIAIILLPISAILNGRDEVLGFRLNRKFKFMVWTIIVPIIILLVDMIFENSTKYDIGGGLPIVFIWFIWFFQLFVPPLIGTPDWMRRAFFKLSDTNAKYMQWGIFLSDRDTYSYSTYRPITADDKAQYNSHTVGLNPYAAIQKVLMDPASGESQEKFVSSRMRGWVFINDEKNGIRGFYEVSPGRYKNFNSASDNQTYTRTLMNKTK